MPLLDYKEQNATISKFKPNLNSSFLKSDAMNLSYL
jgi:hypothetical protein